jgi:hypothetical protein
MRKIAERNGMQISEQWLLATDDRVNNLEHLSRIEHKLIHFANGDTAFLPYTTIENSITLAYEIAEVCGYTNKISSSDGYEVNKGNDWITAISDSDNLKELWKLFCELGFNDLEQRRYANLLTQT